SDGPAATRRKEHPQEATPGRSRCWALLARFLPFVSLVKGLSEADVRARLRRHPTGAASQSSANVTIERRGPTFARRQSSELRLGRRKGPKEKPYFLAAFAAFAFTSACVLVSQTRFVGFRNYMKPRTGSSALVPPR